ncbi:MAG: CooT family nickel-binding protein [Clostridia bacterium]|nr:CooT family nickel-binding protein [Clostridia bacterium]
MCEANAYLRDENGDEILYLEGVDKLMPDGDKIILENIFGQRKIIRAKIKELALVEHKIILEK